MFDEHNRAILLITGIQGAGKSTVAQGVAERLPRSVHLRGDVFRRMVVGGREEMSATPSGEALRQLRLRHQLTAQAADAYFAAGFTVVAQDVVLGEHLAELVRKIHSRPLLVVVLAPSTEEIAAREAGRGKSASDESAMAELNDVLHKQTPRLGLWLDTSEQTPEQTVDEILRRAWPEAVV
jgi:predicted kinase